MKRKSWILVILVLSIFILVPVAYQIHQAWATARTVSHDAVTTYTDNSLIEAGNTVSYSVWMQDNVTKIITQLADHSLAISHPFNDSGLVKGRVYNFWVGAFLQTGGYSDNTPVYAWTVPLGKASQPAGVVVQ